MFDLRYHVASLAAVFVALVIGILVGVAMSGKVDDAEKQALKSDVNSLEAQLNAASQSRAKVSREQTALRAFITKAYPKLIYYNKLDHHGDFPSCQPRHLFTPVIRAAFRSLR